VRSSSASRSRLRTLFEQRRAIAFELRRVTLDSRVPTLQLSLLLIACSQPTIRSRLVPTRCRITPIRGVKVSRKDVRVLHEHES
jgi:hypothetical protein